MALRILIFFFHFRELFALKDNVRHLRYVRFWLTAIMSSVVPLPSQQPIQLAITRMRLLLPQFSQELPFHFFLRHICDMQGVNAET